MRLRRYFLFYISLSFAGLFCCISATRSVAQQYSTIYIPRSDKPVQYKDKELPAEKRSEGGRLKGLKSFTQGLYTHFNYIFNANERTDKILAAAAKQHRDNYEMLLPFYPYDLRSISKDRFWDTVIQKSSAAIALHDVRNAWTDEAYLLLGKAYFFKNILDTALQHFLYLNYAYAPKDDGYDIPLASNADRSGQLHVATPDEKNIFAHKSKRNEGFYWIARILTDQQQYATAKGLLQLVSEDSSLPRKERPRLSEAFAYLYYNERVYDSAAFYLSQCIKTAGDKESQYRRAYLVGQLYALVGDSVNSALYFSKVAKSTPNLLMEIYSELNAAVWQSAEEKSLSLDERLLKLAKKDKYESQRALIYYLLAERKFDAEAWTEAENYIRKSLAAVRTDFTLTDKSFLLLSQIDQRRMDYISMANDYDSIRGVNISANVRTTADFGSWKNTLRDIRQKLFAVEAQDSLLRISYLSESAQNTLLKKQLKAIRKRLGLKDAANDDAGFSGTRFGENSNTAVDLFAADNKSTEWYFNNNALKSKGYNAFIQSFGRRPNVDNWNRLSAVNNQSTLKTDQNGNAQTNVPPSTALAEKVDSSYITIDDLRRHLPLTDEDKSKTKDQIATYYFDVAVALQDKMGLYDGAEYYYRRYLQAAVTPLKKEETLYRLYQIAMLTNRKTLADSVSGVLAATDRTSDLYQKITHPETVLNANADPQNIPATKAYEQIYNQLIEGDFAAAFANKKAADSVYGKNYWTPQLLYIESIYHAHKGDDAVAINTLQQLRSQFAQSPLAAKATVMIDVLKRRKDIENYLTNLKIEPIKEDYGDEFVPYALGVVATEVSLNKNTADRLKTDPTSLNQLSAKGIQTIADTSKLSFVQKDAVSHFDFNPKDAQYACVILDKVDPVFAKEAVNQLNIYHRRQKITQPVQLIRLDERYQLALSGPFTDALTAYDYLGEVMKVAPSQILPWLSREKYAFMMISSSNLDLLKNNKDINGYFGILRRVFPSLGLPADSSETKMSTFKVVSPAVIRPEVKKEEQKLKSVMPVPAAKPLEVQAPNGKSIDFAAKDTAAHFAFDPKVKQYVVVLLTNVEAAFVREAVNMFNKYNRQQGIPSLFTRVDLNAQQCLLLLGPQEDALASYKLLDQFMAAAPVQILPWLPREKYSFLMISPDNLALLLQNQDLKAYKAVLDKAFPNKF